MNDQQIHTKIGEATKLMQHAPKSNLLGQVEIQRLPPLAPRFCTQTRKEYRRALFQAASIGDVTTLNALAGHLEVAEQLIDEETCDNALWVAVAENNAEFAMALLKSPIMRFKLTMPGIKEAMKLSLEQKDKALINALLHFIADTKVTEANDQPAGQDSQPQAQSQ